MFLFIIAKCNKKILLIADLLQENFDCMEIRVSSRYELNFLMILWQKLLKNEHWTEYIFNSKIKRLKKLYLKIKLKQHSITLASETFITNSSKYLKFYIKMNPWVHGVIQYHQIMVFVLEIKNLITWKGIGFMIRTIIEGWCMLAKTSLRPESNGTHYSFKLKKNG